jgi:hypothetical protein
MFSFRMIGDTLSRSKKQHFQQQSRARWKCGKAAALCSFPKRLESDKYRAHWNLSVPDQRLLDASFSTVHILSPAAASLARVSMIF